MQYFVLPALVTATGMLVNAAPVANTGMTGFRPLAPASTRPGEQMAVQWNPDLSGSQEWKHMDISLVSVSKNGKHRVTKLASNVDGTNPNNNVYTATAPVHMRNDNVYYIQFSHGNSKLNSPQFFIENPDSSFSKLHARSGASAQISDTPGAVPDESLYPNGNSDSTEGSDSTDSSSGNDNLLNTMVQQGSAAMDHISQVFQQAAGQSNGNSGSGSGSAMPSLPLGPQAGMPLTIDGVTYVPVPPLVLNQLTSHNGNNSTGLSSDNSDNSDSSDSSGSSGSLSDRLQNAINVGGVTYVPVPREVAEQLMTGSSNSTSTDTNSRESTRGRNSESALDSNDAQDSSSVANLIGQNILSQSALPTNAPAMTSILSSMQREGVTSVDDVSSSSRSHSSSRHHHQSPSSTSSHPRSSSSHARPTSSSSSHSRHHSSSPSSHSRHHSSSLSLASSSSSSALPTSAADASSASSSAAVSSTEAVPTSTANAATDSDTFHNAMAMTATGDAGSMAGLSRRADGPFNHAISRIAQAADSVSLDPASLTMATGSSSNATSATGSGSSSGSASSTSSPSSHHHSHGRNSTSTGTSTDSTSSSATRSSHHHGSSSTAVPSSVVDSLASSLSINPERASSLLRSLGRSDNDVSDSVSYYLGMDPLAGFGDSSATATSSSHAVPTSTASGSMTRMRQGSSADSSSNTRTRSRSSADSSSNTRTRSRSSADSSSNTGSSSASSGRGNSRSSSRSATGDSSDSVMQVLAQGILGNSGLSSDQIDQYYSEMNAQPTGTSNSRGNGNGQMGASLHYSSAAASMSEAY